MQGMIGTQAAAVMRRDDWLGAIAMFLAVFVSTFPVAIPFPLINDPWLAMRVSNGVALSLLFLAGYTLGRYAQHRPWRMGIGVMLVGWVLVGITIALGG